MKSWFVSVGERMVPLDDPRIEAFSQRTADEVAQYGSFTDRDIRLELVAAHSTNLSSIQEQLFVDLASDDDKPVQPDTTLENILTVAVNRPSDTSRDFIMSYAYNRSTRALNVDFGPDSSTGLRALHGIAVHEAEALAEKAMRFRRAQLMDWRFSLNVIGKLMDRVVDRNHDQADILDQQIDNIGRLLMNFETEMPDADDTQDEIADDDELANTYKLDIPQHMYKKIDLTVLKLVRRLDRTQSSFLNAFEPDVLTSLLINGDQVLKARGQREHEHGEGGLAIARVPYQDQASCSPVNQAFPMTVDMFFPERGASTFYAKAVCGECVIKDECLDFALGNNIKTGIWGGTSERERRSIRKIYGAAEEE